MFTNIDAVFKIESHNLRPMHINYMQQSLTLALFAIRSLYSPFAFANVFVDLLGVPVVTDDSASWTINTHRGFTTVEQLAEPLPRLSDTFESEIDLFLAALRDISNGNRNISASYTITKANTFETEEEQIQYDREKKNG